MSTDNGALSSSPTASDEISSSEVDSSEESEDGPEPTPADRDWETS